MHLGGPGLVSLVLPQILHPLLDTHKLAQHIDGVGGGILAETDQIICGLSLFLGPITLSTQLL